MEARSLSDTAGLLAFEYLGQMMPAVQLKQGILTFHGALVEHDGAAVAICAPSGIGKTTHARLWRDCKNALILNGDRAVFRKEKGKWISWGTPWSGTSGEQICRSAPLKALVLLERGEVNQVERLQPQNALRVLMSHLLYPSWDGRLTVKAFELMDDLLGTIPVYRLRCRPEGEAVEVLCREIYGAL